MSALAGRRVLVTGGSRGIGRATALAFARAGAAVAFNYSRDEDEGEATETLDALRATGMPAHGAQADVADAAAVAALFAELREALGGPPDVLVNNAAVTHDGLLMMLPEAGWRRVLDVDLTGAFLCSKAALRGMIAGRWGRIVNVVSPAAFFGKEGASAYAAAKGGLVALTKSLAREVARLGITVNAVSPGFVRDSPHQRAGRARAWRPRTPDPARALRRSRTRSPAAIVFLASPAASYLTGTTVHVDGGLTML